MKFSVLMSLYYHEQPKYLSECFDGLAIQTVPADEIVLVFDGLLTPELEKVVEDYQNILPLKIIRLSENVGLGRALNHGLEYCTYEWVFRMDTDDVCIPNRFKKQCDFIMQNSEISLLGGQIAEFQCNLNELKNIRRVPEIDHEIRIFAKKRNPFNHMTVAFRKSIIQSIGGYYHHLYMEDYNLWLRLLSQNVIVANLPDILVYVRIGEKNNMLKRRRGIYYINSEWKLYNLKRKLKIQNELSALFLLVIRTLPRLFPLIINKFIYKKLRTK